MSTEIKGKQNIKISGSGTAGGGKYDEVRISGSGKITGDIECSQFRIDGSAKVEGNLTTVEMEINGTGTIKQELKAESMEINGTGTVEGNAIIGKLEVNGSTSFKKELQVKEFEVNGSSKVKGRITGGVIEVNGMLKVQESCEVESVRSYGSIQVNELLSADSIEIHVGYHSSAKEVGGERIVVKQHKANKFIRQIINFFNKDFERFEADTIEGDEINLEVTKAKLVRGKNIIIGKKCEVERVEYTDTLQIHPESSVIDAIKL